MPLVLALIPDGSSNQRSMTRQSRLPLRLKKVPAFPVRDILGAFW
jgi:hypothetical protein